MLTKLLLSNVAYDCSDDALRKWIEDHGYAVVSLKLIRDVVSGTSPSFAHVQLATTTKLNDAARMLDGSMFRGRVLHVRRGVPGTNVA